MFLKSKIPLTYNSGVSGQATTVVLGLIPSFSRNGECTTFGANFQYLNNDIEGDEKPIILQGAFYLKSTEEIQAVYNMIKADLPSTDDEPLYERTKIYLAFRLEMYQTFLPLNPDLVLTDIDVLS